MLYSPRDYSDEKHFLALIQKPLSEELIKDKLNTELQNLKNELSVSDIDVVSRKMSEMLEEKLENNKSNIITTASKAQGDIVLELSKGSSLRPREIAEKTGLSQSSVHRSLKELVARGIVTEILTSEKVLYRIDEKYDVILE